MSPARIPHPPLTAEQQALALTYTGLVVSAAIAFKNHHPCHHLTLADLIQEGFAALCAALTHYDPTQSAASTFFSRCIFNGMKRAWQCQEFAIRLPENVHLRHNKAVQAQWEQQAETVPFSYPPEYIRTYHEHEVLPGSGETDDLTVADLMPSPEEAVPDTVLRDLGECSATPFLDYCLAHLPDQVDRTLLQLLYRYEWSLPRIASRTGRTQGELRTSWARLQQQLREVGEAYLAAQAEERP